jgi:DNA-binding MarR family transcriptional regulator
VPELENELQILQEIERNPDLTQASLAIQMGVAVGSVNWYLKRLIGKGYVKVTHLQRRKLHYFLTPSGLARKFELTRGYLDVSLRLYRELREAAAEILDEVDRRAYRAIYIEGSDEAVEILHLTALERGIQTEKTPGLALPILRSTGVAFAVTWPRDGITHQGDEETE